MVSFTFTPSPPPFRLFSPPNFAPLFATRSSPQRDSHHSRRDPQYLHRRNQPQSHSCITEHALLSTAEITSSLNQHSKALIMGFPYATGMGASHHAYERNPSPYAMQNTFEDLWLSRDYSDMEIICGDETFPAHRVVICRRSHWFKTACSSGFKVKSFIKISNPPWLDLTDETQESSGVIHLAEKDPIVVKKVLEYLYKSDYSMRMVAMDVCTPVGENSPSVNQFGLRKRKLATTLSPDTVASLKQSPRKRARSTLELPGARVSVDLTPFPQASESQTCQTSDIPPGQTIEEYDEDWPPLTICPPCYFHARIYAEADFFMLDDLKELAKRKFNESLEICNVVWKLQLLLLELWSDRADYRELRSLLLYRIRDVGTELNMLFLELDLAFLGSVPGFTADFCDEHMKRERDLLDLDATPHWKKYRLEKPGYGHRHKDCGNF
ncbi:hypothetical protein N7456_011047 [Penicillium angulare]|uniref:BTB domain-containing protein n=1 Tax=Penicillium angulare TaxID=116970 RepID=A0A9W9ET79_9EURO|nr:hypothetical protein N7456_011047 [Penicillium angulare]